MLASIFSLPIGALVKAFFSFLTSWVAEGAATLLDGLAAVLQHSTGPLLGGVVALSPTVVSIAASMCLPLLLLAVLQGIVRQELGFVLRAAFLRLPAAAVLGTAAVTLVGVLVQITDQMSATILSAAGPSEHVVLDQIATAVVLSSTATLSGFAVLLLGGAAAVVALLLWVELTLRSAAVEVAALLCPLALAGLVWPATSHWARRLGETIVALVFSKVVIAATLALAAETVARGSGVAAAVQGVALLALASFAPFALLRLAPMVESGSAGHLEGLSQRARRAAGSAVSLGRSVAGGQGAQSWDALQLLGGQQRGGLAEPAPQSLGIEPLAPGGAFYAGPGGDPFAVGSPLYRAAQAEEAAMAPAAPPDGETFTPWHPAEAAGKRETGRGRSDRRSR